MASSSGYLDGMPAVHLEAASPSEHHGCGAPTLLPQQGIPVHRRVIFYPNEVEDRGGDVLDAAIPVPLHTPGPRITNMPSLL